MTGPAAGEFQAIGTEIRVVVGDPGVLDTALRLVRREIGRIDLACSRFRADSELVRANARAGEVVSIGPLLAEAVAVALRGARDSQGRVDPTVGMALVELGYRVTFGDVVPDIRPLPLARAMPSSWEQVELDATRGTLRVPTGVALDLGATAKAWASDRCAALVLEGTGSPALVSCGGDLAVAGEPPDGGWVVSVSEERFDADAAAGQLIRIEAGGVATSSTTVRSWERGGQAVHHIVDPGTGLPAGGPWRTATVAAASCVDANVAATAAIILGDAAVAWLEEGRLPARLVGSDGTVVTTAGWPVEEGG